MTVWLTAKNNEKLHQIKKLHYLCVEVATRVTLTETYCSIVSNFLYMLKLPQELRSLKPSKLAGFVITPIC